MMTVDNQIEVRKQPVMTLNAVEALKAMARAAAMSGFVNSSEKDLVKKSADAFFVMALGVELGFSPIASLQIIHVIKGKPTCSGQAMLSLMRRAGCEIELPDIATVTDSVTVRIKRPNATEWHAHTYTMAMANSAGLSGRDMWQKYPAYMLMWRAVATAARFEASDIIGGLYTVEEVAPEIDVNEDGAIIDMKQLEAPKPETSTATPPPVATEAGQGSEPETGAEDDDAVEYETSQAEAVSLKTKVGKNNNRFHTLRLMDSDGREGVVTLYTRRLLIEARQITESDHRNEGDDTRFAIPFTVTLQRKVGKRPWTVVEVERAMAAIAPQSELDAASPRDESGQPVMPGTPPPEETGVDFYGEERAQ